MILSAVVHAALIFAALYGGSRLMVADRMPGAGRGRGGGGGGGASRALLLYSPPAAAPAGPTLPLPPPLVVPKVPPVPLPEVKPPDVTPPPPQLSTAQLLAALGRAAGPGQGSGAGPGAGSGSGGGNGSGRGAGTGPDSGGAGGRLYPPTPRQIILPPSDRPASVRGTTITVRFEISERGDVMRVSMSPTPRDHTFASQFAERLKQYTFTPATTLDGRPVAAIYEIRITL